MFTTCHRNKGWLANFLSKLCILLTAVNLSVSHCCLPINERREIRSYQLEVQYLSVFEWFIVALQLVKSCGLPCGPQPLSFMSIRWVFFCRLEWTFPSQSRYQCFHLLAREAHFLVLLISMERRLDLVCILKFAALYVCFCFLYLGKESKSCACVKDCLHVEFCALRLTSWSMCLTDESGEDKLQRILSGYLAS